ncbi:hypothetical protein PFICI_04393 [Pestalotiopsis fici W106-1]|uniref:Ubiquitin-like domain-containing protein n=1 Tax=Pestalotiopsis fici (strain W106-1 / CGMCC3.15140) TaxID=1229662 RepID=W3XAQ6_PESFW|nr:uncharacterized protein PFICI_04393 [Pestalotiopsis fici W106-1]ETS82517.1 hypothetical protein PFICI_04393 [Pestalotiopsis fici W106-1]
MADPLSIAASVVGLASVGFEIAKSLHGLADAVGSAGEQVRVYASEIEVFSRVLQLVRYQLHELQDVSINGLELLKDIVDICEDIVKRLHALMQSLGPLLSRFKDSKNKLLQFGIRLEWILTKKEKLLFYRATLKQQQRNLTMAMNAIRLKTSRDRSDPSVRLARSSLESTLAIQATLKSAKFSTQMLRSSNESSQAILTSRTLDPFHQDLPESTTDTSSTTQTEVNVDGDGVDDAAAKIENGALVLASVDSLTDDDLAAIDQLESSLEPSSLPSTYEVWEEMRVLTRRTVKFAKKILNDEVDSTIPLLETRSGTDGYTTSAPVDASAPIKTSVPVDASAPVNPTIPTDSPAPAHSAPGQSPRINASQQSNLKSPSMSTLPSRIEKPVPPNPDNWIKVEDSFGNSHLCAYDDCSTWEGICTFIGSMKPNLARNLPEYNKYWRSQTGEDRYRDLVQSRDFHFVGADDMIIGANAWSLVQPGWTVQLEFSDDDFNTNPNLKRARMEKSLAWEKSEAETHKAKEELRIMKESPLPDMYQLQHIALQRISFVAL